MPAAVVPPVTARLDLLDPAEVARLGGLELITTGIVEGFLAGLHRSPRRGFFVEFAEHRMYQPGDEPRYLDWRLLARSDRLYVKQFEEETNLRAMLVLDASASMDWSGAPATRLTKRAYADCLVAALALVLLRQRDATGLLTFDDRVRRVLPPRARQWAKTGCKCSGFQTGRDSMLCASSASRTSSRVAPKRSGSIVMHVSQQLLSPCGASGMKSMPGTLPSAAS